MNVYIARVNLDTANYVNLRQSPSIRSELSATAAPGPQVVLETCAEGPDEDGLWFQLGSGR